MARKAKTKRGAAKRILKTAGGYKKRRAFRNHILTKKAKGLKRKRRANNLVKKCDVLQIRRLLGDEG